MKKLMLPFAVMSVLALGVQACEVQGGEEDDTFTTTDTVTTTDTTTTEDTTVAATEYYAVFLEDLSEVRCATSSSGAHGADIDAVALFDGNDLVGYLDVIDADHPTDCSTYGHDDTSEAKGAPSSDASLTKGYYSLSFGWLIGEFDGAAQIVSGYEIVVYEIDDAYCTAAGLNPGVNCVGSEPYAVSIATGLDCVNESDPNACMLFISDTAEGTATVPLSGF
ncbi:MAG: hypothetical protein EP329_03950 [Deltaproteobacteria bacterium]|nr:MAG: hypothetical protein EP329_03950 [Deltaproteobacteria bacterium]